MLYLEFRYGQLCIKDEEILMNYQLYDDEPKTVSPAIKS